MPLSSCPTCNGKVSTNASACPHCGEPLGGAAKVNQKNSGGLKKHSKLRYIFWAAGGLISLSAIAAVGIVMLAENEDRQEAEQLAERLGNLYRVAVPSLNQLSCPSEDCDVIARSPKGLIVRVFETQGGWSRTSKEPAFGVGEPARWVPSASLVPVNLGKSIAVIVDAGGRYEGQAKGEVANGIGIYKYRNDDRYEGEYRDGKRHGVGTHYYELRYGVPEVKGGPYILDTLGTKVHGKVGPYDPTGSRYEGDYLNDMRDGTGAHYFANGDRYEGDWVADVMHGKGTFYYSNGHRYEGEFQDGLQQGTGAYYFVEEGERYEGEFAVDMFYGAGTYFYKDGSRYEGDWMYGLREGVGTSYYNNGARYEGDYFDDVKHGTGTYTFVNGDRYEGEFNEGKLTGKGIMYEADGDRYEGDFVGGKYNGNGTYFYADGDRYEGEFNEDKLTGKGIMYGANGYRYEGDFVGGKYNGNGTFYADGNRYTGEFVESKFNGVGKYYFANGDRYEGEFRDNKFEGIGTRYAAAGGNFKGEFKGGWPNGKGEAYIEDTGATIKGSFLKDKPRGEMFIHHKNGNIYSALFENGAQKSDWTPVSAADAAARLSGQKSNTVPNNTKPSRGSSSTSATSAQLTYTVDTPCLLEQKELADVKATQRAQQNKAYVSYCRTKDNKLFLINLDTYYQFSFCEQDSREVMQSLNIASSKIGLRDSEIPHCGSVTYLKPGSPVYGTVWKSDKGAAYNSININASPASNNPNILFSGLLTSSLDPNADYDPPLVRQALP